MTTPDLRHRFAYHPPKNDAVREAHEYVRLNLGDLAAELDYLLPDGREKATCLTKLEEAMFWANAAIARNPDGIPTEDPRAGYPNGA